jgi:hypothetical protein
VYVSNKQHNDKRLTTERRQKPLKLNSLSAWQETQMRGVRTRKHSCESGDEKAEARKTNVGLYAKGSLKLSDRKED